MVGTSNYFLISEYISTNVITAMHMHIDTSRICNKFEDVLHALNQKHGQHRKH